MTSVGRGFRSASMRACAFVPEMDASLFDGQKAAATYAQVKEEHVFVISQKVDQMFSAEILAIPSFMRSFLKP